MNHKTSNRGIDLTGKNIVNKIDFDSLSKQFVDFFYINWQTGNLEIKNVINNYSRIKYNKIIFTTSEDIIKMLFTIAMKGINIQINDVNTLESGSRRIDIMVNGYITDISTNTKHTLTQYFLLANQDNSWKIQNSILNIFI